jgi:TrmH family RNA methyltransferase
VITSTANERIKRIRSLRQRKFRDRTNTCFVEGLRAVGEAVQLQAGIETLVVAPDLLVSEFGAGLVEQARAGGVEVIEVAKAVFERLSERDTPQGVGAVVRQRWERLDDLPLEDGDCWVALDGIADPGNAGAVIRTCDAVGSPGVIFLDATVDPYSPGSIRASTGTIFSRRVARATFDELVAWTRERGGKLVGTSDGAIEDFREADYGRATVLLMGREREGLSEEQAARCDALVSIPMAGHADSLNLAVATGVLLYEIVERRRRSLDLP